MPSFTDQLGRTITLDHPGHSPLRIVSLVPSQTELLYNLGQESPPLSFEVVGITKFCVHPPAWFRTKPRIGGTKDIRPEKIAALQPDLIIANKEENVREQVEALATRYPVWVSDIPDLAAALVMIRSIGTVIGRSQQAQTLADRIQKDFDALSPFPASFANPPSPPVSPSPSYSVRPTRSPRTAYLIWRTGKPLSYMAAGRDTFIDDMLHHCGLTNVVDQPRYPVTDPAALAAAGCELVLLSSEPYPFRDKHREELQAFLPKATIRLVDGEMFSWYGSRLLHAPAYFRRLFTECE
jgi:ABC-type Fe3+-hydroxamate transport system substrate-binding protein